MKKPSRRFFLQKALLATAATVVAKPVLAQTNHTRIIHQVFFWLKNPGSASHRKLLAEGIKKLAAITVVKQLYVGFPAHTEKREVVDTSWDVSELMFFDGLEAQQKYQDHPLHQAFIQEYAHLWKKVVVYDTVQDP